MLKRPMLYCCGLLLLAGALPAGVQPYPYESWFEQDPKPMPIVAESVGNPLDYAGARIGLDVRNVELPRGWEGAYRYCCRFPIIDYVSNRPLYMKQWAEERSAGIVRYQRRFGIQAAWYADDFFDGYEEHPDDSGPGYDNSRDAVIPSTFEADSAGRQFKSALESLPFSEEYRVVLTTFYTHLYRMLLYVRAATSDLDEDDEAFFAAEPGFYLAPDGKRMAELTGNTDAQLEFIHRARPVCYGTITGAAASLSVAISEYVTATQNWRPEDFYVDGGVSRSRIRLSTPLGGLIVTGPGNDTITEEAVVMIDLGGNDTYLNNAGSTGRHGGVAVCLDHSGNDRYESPDSSYVQGFGFLGVGMLVDLAGNDVYKAKHFSQGAGILGVGVLWDRAGSDTFSAHTFCQGAGMFGLGMVLDDSGNDVYDCASNGQGSATTLGMGILSDLEGNDKYRLACDTTKDAMGGLPGYGQGGALSFRAYPWEKKLVAYGGVGMLVDDKGNDDYVSKGWNCQGGSYIMSLGVLVDNEGNDHYDCGTGQGSGIHVTNAILIDKKGDDAYEGGFRSGGSGSDRSPGFLIDYEGNDTYKSNTSSYGTGCKPFSYSLFIDYKGDDRYICARPESTVLMNDWHSFGGVWPESDPNAWPYAISLDLGGKDKYEVRNRQNNSETHSFGHGIHLDMEWKGGDIAGKIERLPVNGWLSGLVEAAPDALGLPKTGLPADLGHHFSERFNSVGEVVDAGPRLLPDVVKMMLWAAAEPNVGYCRTLLEIIHYWFVKGQIGAGELPEVLRLLKTGDAEVRLIMADDLGLWKMRGAENALVEAAGTDSVAQVRRFALRSLLRLESKKGLALARRLATEDTSEDVRRVSVSYLSRVRDTADVVPLLRYVLAEDKAPSVRCAAADGLGLLGDQRGVEPLREAAKTFDVYVQRACAKALCQLYDVEGIGMLIESMSFPSIDAFYNYDRNVPNYVSAYAGFDLPDSERYVQVKWRQWFKVHRDSINIRYNADAYRAWTSLADSLRDLPDSAQVARYEAFLARFPDYDRARKELAGKLNGIAWNFATAPKGTRGSDPELALKYARRAVELSDDPNIWDTLVEAYLANGLRDEALRVCRESLEKHPNDGTLKGRLKQLEGGNQ